MISAFTTIPPEIVNPPLATLRSVVPVRLAPPPAESVPLNPNALSYPYAFTVSVGFEVYPAPPESIANPSICPFTELFCTVNCSISDACELESVASCFFTGIKFAATNLLASIAEIE